MPCSRTTPRDGVPSPAIDPQDRRLAGAVGAEQREHLAPPDLEADVEQHLDVAVGEVDGVDLERRDVLGLGLLAPVLLELLAQLGHDQRQVVADRPELRSTRSPPMMRRRARPSSSTAARGADGVGEERRQQRPAGRADEEHVDRAERGAHARAAGTARPPAARAATIVNAVISRTLRDHADDRRTAAALGMAYWIGEETADRDDQRAEQPQRLRRDPPEQAVVAAGDERQHQQHAEPVARADQPASEGARARSGPRGRGSGSTGPVNRPKPSAANARTIAVEGLDPVAAGRTRPPSRWAPGSSSSMTSPSTSASRTGPGRLGDAEGEEGEREHGEPSRRYAHRQPSGPPASAAMPPTSAGLSRGEPGRRR